MPRKLTLGGKQIKIEYVPIASLKPAVYNPRKWDEAELEKLKQSIRKFQFLDPCIVNAAANRKGIVIGGHMRIAAAQELGYAEVPCVFVDIPDEASERELNLRLNRATGTWDFEKLKNFDVELLLDVGFSDSDLSAIWDENLETESDGFELDKELEQIRETDIKLGDLFALGNHRLICGNSRDLKTVKRLVGSDKMDLIYCDPNYNVNLSYNKGVGGKSNYGGSIDDSKSDFEYEMFLADTLAFALEVSNPDVHCFYWCDERYIGLLQHIFDYSGLNSLRVCYWLKNGFNPTPNVAFNKVLEACVYGTKGRPFLNSNLKNLHEVLNKEIGTGNQLTDDVLDMLNIWLCKRDAGQDYLHPTQKPVSLHERPLRRCTKPGDNVLDLFGGGGSTLLACQQLKRRAFLSEIEPIFCQVIINRFERYTNEKAKKLN